MAGPEIEKERVMSCDKTFAVAIEDLLLEPNSLETRGFRRHCETCEDCATELGAHEALLLKLRGEDAHERRWHPADAELLSFRAEPAAMDQQLRERINRHFESCAPCHDAFEAFRRLAVAASATESVAAPAGALLDRISEWLSESFGALRPASVALAALAIVGVAILTNAPFTSDLQEEPVYRGGEPVRAIAPEPAGSVPEEGRRGFTLWLLPSETLDASADTFSQGDSLDLILTLPQATDLPDRLFVTLRSERRLLVGAWQEVDRSDRATIVLELDTHQMSPGRYSAEVFVHPDATKPLHVYTLLVD
jgi:hypothetical protein